MVTLGAVPASFALVQEMKVDADYLRYVLGGVITDENQKLLLKLEELIMSNITPVLQEILTKVTTIKSNNDSLAASLVEKDQQLAEANAKVDAALQNATDSTDMQLLADLKALLS